MECVIVYRNTNLVGNNITVRAEILENGQTFKKLMDTIIIEISGGASMSDEVLKLKILEIYNG